MTDGRPKKPKLQVVMEETELRSLRIPSAAHRGALSPSKNSFLPTLQEHAHERIQQMHKRERNQRVSPDSRQEAEQKREQQQLSQQQQQSPQRLKANRSEDDISGGGLAAGVSCDLLEGMKQDFAEHGGSLDLEDFTRAILRNLAAQGQLDDGPVQDQETAAMNKKLAKLVDGERDPHLVAAVIELFERVDVHDEGTTTWEEVSNYLIEQGMAGNDEFTVDNIKSYEPSKVLDQSKHESFVEKLIYLEQIDSVVCLAHNSRRFRLYDPVRCSITHEVSGHRGTVVNCCFVDAFSQIATTSADMTICLWDSVHLGLRNRLSAKDVQLCLQWEKTTGSLFTGSIDGALSRWDLNHMCLADTRKGQHKKAINDLLMVQDIDLLASASSDGTILMWDAATMRPKKTFKGHVHKKGTFSLAYSMDYHCLLTAGLDQEALVWNPYVERVPIFRLKGHTHALCGVQVVPSTPQILTADVTGMFRLWDMRNFRCVQSFSSPDNHDLNSFCAIPQHKRLASGGHCVTLFDYMDEWGGETVTDTGGVMDALYNPQIGNFYTLSKQSVKIWDASSGLLSKVLKDVSSSEITAACISDNGRKLYLGDSSGRIAAHSLTNGRAVTEFERHFADISCLTIQPGTSTLFSASWDGVVKVHQDELSRQPQVRMEFKNHRDGVTCLACSSELQLLASGGSDMQVMLYDLRSLKHEHSLTRFSGGAIAGVAFHTSRCLLVVADQGGMITLWRMRPHADKHTCVFHFWNVPGFLGMPAGSEGNGLPSSHQPVAVTALQFGPKSEADNEAPLDSAVTLYTADTKGVIRCWDLSVACAKRHIHPVDIKELWERQRRGHVGATHHPPTSSQGHRSALTNAEQVAMIMARQRSQQTNSPPVLPTSQSQTDSKPTATAAPSVPAFLTSLEQALEDDDDPKSKVKAKAGAVAAGNSASLLSMDNGEARVAYEVVGHSDAIITMQVTSQPCAVLTCGHDRRVRAWSIRLEPKGTLLQNHDSNFQFPYDNSLATKTRLAKANALLAKLGPTETRPKLPALMPRASFSREDALGFGQSRVPYRAKQKRDNNSQWKAMVEQVIDDPLAVEEDYQMLFEQLQRLGEGLAIDGPASRFEDRLLKQFGQKRVDQMQHRSTAMSSVEASAAGRLARALDAIGSDEHGMYAAMARSLQPKAKLGRQASGGYPNSRGRRP
mmetsp:Transcript_11200/g.25514  ORF Transcript_11200/g.25514 Transcript_11200/m.25514 type:complete len:1185 (+) Transcript_11200:55-3609(+)